METYNDLFVRLNHGTTAAEVLARLQALSGGDMTWELEEDLGGAAGFHAMGGSAGWELTDAAAESLLQDGHLDVWTYSTHDEDPEAVFSRYSPDQRSSFVVSTAYAEWEEEEDDQAEQLHGGKTPDEALSENDWRQKLGENVYCWSRYDRWVNGMPVFHRRAGHEELIEDIVGRRRTKTEN